MRRYSDEEIAAAVSQSRSKRAALEILDKTPSGGTTRWLNRRIAVASIDTSHMTGIGWRKGLKAEPLPLEHYLALNGPWIRGRDLRGRLIAAGLKQRRCERCGIETWMDEPAPLQLEHVNGNPQDNRLENLQILCANCHCLTPTYARNKVARGT